MSIWGGGSVLLRERWAPGVRDESDPTDPGLVSPSLTGEKWPEDARASPDGFCQRPGGAGGSESVLLEESCDSCAFGGIILRLIWPEVVESPLARRAVSGLSCSTVAVGALRTWDSVRGGERGPADPVDAFKSGPPVGGTKLSTGGGFLPADLLGKGDEVANLVGSSSTGKRVERPPLVRGNAESSFTLDLGASVSAFPHLKPS